ncbi:hypothetical protein PHET_11653 [Paragonimus heterotremus]|uniref:Uncharacterized protein n=1 Tax=Paragonimus heterotremus TaxID=100268 RepID=A0A8J4SRL1_9TREM|nr:hypothetical protein PHET_11653 [Paragonimus heterotremus]
MQILHNTGHQKIKYPWITDKLVQRLKLFSQTVVEHYLCYLNTSHSFISSLKRTTRFVRLPRSFGNAWLLHCLVVLIHVDAMDAQSRRNKLIEQIVDWNACRLDLFELSMPDEKGEFNGVMRFFYQDEYKRYQTKCVRVSSTDKTSHVVEVLQEKFFLTDSSVKRMRFGIYEHYANGGRLFVLFSLHRGVLLFVSCQCCNFTAR